MRKIIEIAKYIWQLPQHIVALFILLYLRITNTGFIDKVDDKNVFIRWSDGGSMSLGKYIFLSTSASKDTIKHECNHCNQSIVLGPIYLLIIGLPSIIHCGIYLMWWNLFRITWDYYSFYTEHWMFKD